MDILKTIIDIRNIESYKEKDRLLRELIKDSKEKDITYIECKELLLVCEHLYWISTKISKEAGEYYCQNISNYFKKYYNMSEDFFKSNTNSKMLVEVAEIFDSMNMKNEVITFLKAIIASNADEIFKIMAIEKFYAKYRFIDVNKIDENQLKRYSRLFLETFYKNRDSIYLKLIDIVDEKLIEVCGDDESYNRHFCNLLLSNQHKKLYEKSKALFEKGTHNDIALKYLTNFVLVANGYMKFSEYEKYLRIKNK